MGQLFLVLLYPAVGAYAAHQFNGLAQLFFGLGRIILLLEEFVLGGKVPISKKGRQSSI
jgi:hypothetical protein